MGRIGDVLSRCGLTEREFASVRVEMQEKNRRMLALISVIAAVSYLSIFLSGVAFSGGVVQAADSGSIWAWGCFPLRWLRLRSGCCRMSGG